MPKAGPMVAVVGSCNIDLTTFADHFPKPGETIFGKHFDLGFGGKGANQAVAARLCGAEVAMVARVGNDLFGPATIQNFAALGIDCEHVKIVEGASSGVAPIFVESNGQNRIIVVKGANDCLLPPDVGAAARKLRAADCIILQLEIPLETVYYTLRFAKTNGIRCILNPAPAQPLDFEAVRDADFLIPNESEAATLSGLPVHSHEDARKCADFFLSKGLRGVILTLGAEGALLATTEGLHHVLGYQVASRDTTGAGDAFIGSLAVFLSEGLAPMEAVARANLYAALSTMKVGTQKSFLTRAAFESEWARRAGESK